MRTWAARNRALLVDCGFVSLACLLVLWPFLVHPGEAFYNRFFEAGVIFNPSWLLSTYATGWSYNQHLGSQSSLEPAYLSILIPLMVPVVKIFGAIAASKIYPFVLQALPVVAMYAFARYYWAELPRWQCALIALFFGANPVVAGMLHDGYSSSVLNYISIPLSLLWIDRALAQGKPHRLLALPLYFLLTGHYRLPLVVLNWIFIFVLRGKPLVRQFRASPWLTAAFAAVLLVNLYWLLPALAFIKLSPVNPLASDTAGELQIIDKYASLSNVTLLKLFGAFGADNGICGTCAFYNGAYYLIAIVSLVAIGVYGLLKSRNWTIMGVLAASICLNTGYKYQDALIGVPYQILAGLPTLGIFRDANKFSLLIVFCYCVGMAAALSIFAASRRRTILFAWTAVATIFSCLPILTGSILESSPRTPLGSFFVRIPGEYWRAKAFSAVHPPTADTAVLLAPSSGDANYDWGGRDSDFLYYLFGTPVVQRLHWPEPNPFVDQDLSVIYDPRYTPLVRNSLLSALRVSRVFVRDDVLNQPRVQLRSFGSVEQRFGRRYAFVTPALPPIPLFETAPAAANAASAATEAAYRTIAGEVTRDSYGAIAAASPPPLRCPAGGIVYARSDFAVFTEWKRLSVFDNLTGCTAPVSVSYRVQGKPDAEIVLVRRRGNGKYAVAARLPTHVVPQGGDVQVSAVAAIPRRLYLALLARSSRTRALSARISAPNGAPLEPAPAGVTWYARPLLAKTSIPPNARVFVLNESYSASWIALQDGRARPHFLANGYANGWDVKPGALVLLNVAQAVWIAGVVLAVLAAVAALVLYLFVLRKNSNRTVQPA